MPTTSKTYADQSHIPISAKLKAAKLNLNPKAHDQLADNPKLQSKLSAIADQFIFGTQETRGRNRNKRNADQFLHSPEQFQEQGRMFRPGGNRADVCDGARRENLIR